MSWRSTLSRVLFGVFCLWSISVIIFPRPSLAAINQQINFQGKITNPDGTNVTNNSYTIVFAIYTVSSGGVAVWSESKSVAVSDGIFQTALGDTTALPGSVDFNGASLFLGIKVGADAEMSPRIQFTAAPYAFNSDKLNGLASSAFGQLVSSQTWTGTNTLQPTTNIITAIIKQTAFGSPTADILDLQTANNTNIIQVTGPAANEAAVTINSVGATRTLTLDSASGTIVLGTNTTTLQKSGTAFSFDLNSASSSTLTITNAGAGVASLSVEGNITTAATIGTASTTTFTGAGATFSGVVAANGGVTFDNSTDTLGAYTLGGTLDAGTNIITNIGNTGTDFVAATGALNLAGILTASAGISLAANQDLTLSAGTGTLTLNSTVTNASEDAILITPSYTGGATDLLTYNGISIAGFSPANGAGTDKVNGIKIGNLTDPGATITSSAINIGSGWDAGLTFVASSAGATANSFTIKNSAATPRNLFELRDLTANSNQFGSLALADAFVSRQSYINEEFNSFRSVNCTDGTFTVNSTHNSSRGTGSPLNTACGTGVDLNNGPVSTSAVSTLNNAANTCTFASGAAATNYNGYERITPNVGNGNQTLECLEYFGTSADTTPNNLFNSGNFPQIVIKARMSAAGAGQRSFIGISNISSAKANPVVGDKGVYFTNCSAPNTPTCVATGWYGAVQDGTNAANMVTCPTAGFALGANFSYLRIEMRKATSTTAPEIEFFVDNDVSDGIAEVTCGAVTATTNAMGNTAMTMFYMAVDSGNAVVTHNFDVDYFRVWQDDAPGVNGGVNVASAAKNNIVPGTTAEDLSTKSLAVNSPISKPTTNNVLAIYLAIMGTVGVYVTLIYRNHLAKKEIKRLSSPNYLSGIIKTVIANRVKSTRYGIDFQKPGAMSDNQPPKSK